MKLKGGPELRARLKAIALTFKPYGKEWADEYVSLAKPRVPFRTGQLRNSIRRKSATQKRAVVAAWYTAYFIDAGVRPHSVAKGARLRKSKTGTIFTPRKKLHPGFPARPFRRRTAIDALRRRPMALALIRQWNLAARGRSVR